MIERVVSLEGGYVAPWSRIVQVGAVSVPITIAASAGGFYKRRCINFSPYLDLSKAEFPPSAHQKRVN